MNKTKISAEIVADSLDSRGNRLTSLLITFPRIILAEINTHRMLSKNTSSSRAIPFKKMVEAIENDPFIPIAWQKEHKGMQGTEYVTEPYEIENRRHAWIASSYEAIKHAQWLTNLNVTKQLCNRLLEPFMWTTMLITGSKEGWDNFFELRCPSYLYDYEDNPIYFKSKKEWVDYYNESQGYKENNPDFIKVESFTDLEWLKLNKGQAEIHMMTLAEAIYDAINESTPKQLESGQWHIPFESKMDIPSEQYINIANKIPLFTEDFTTIKLKTSVAMAARTSYTVVGEEKSIDYEKMIELHNRLIAQDPPHSSPLEHCARAMSEIEYTSCRTSKLAGKNGEYGWCGPYKGFISYRYFIDNNLEV